MRIIRYSSFSLEKGEVGNGYLLDLRFPRKRGTKEKEGKGNPPLPIIHSFLIAHLFFLSALGRRSTTIDQLSDGINLSRGKS